MSAGLNDQRTHRIMTDHGEPLAVPADVDIAKARTLPVQLGREPKSAASAIKSGVISPSSSVHSDPDDEEPHFHLGPHGWILASQCCGRSASRNSMASGSSCGTDETPLTPMSAPDDDALDLSGLPELSQVDIKQKEPRPVFPIPFRPKHQSNQESWDSAIGSDFTGRRRGYASPTSLCGMSDYGSIRSLVLGPQLPVPEPSKSDGTAERRPIKSEASHAAEFSLPHTEESDSDETVSDETVSNETIPPADAVGRVLNYTLDAVFGLANDDAVHVPSVCSIVANFISDMAWAIDKALGQKQAPGYVCAADLSRQPTSASTSSAGTNSSNRSSPSSDKGKRKAQDGGEDDQDGDDERDERDNKRKGSGPSKRPKPNSFRMSCPFRKKNPLRFNVRDYRLCALTVFTDTAELRRHIQDVHRRPAINHQCPRCQSQFSTQDEFADHLRSADICSLVETRLGSEDPEDGVDEAIVNTLRSKKGRVSDPVRVQWQKIWELLFPGTPVQPYEYCAVMEHFELHEKCRSSLPHLRESLRAIGLSETGLDSLGSILDNYFIGLFEQCNEEGRQKDYRNRQPKAQQAQPRATRRSSSERTANNAHRDSAVDVGMDNEVVPDENAQSKPDGPEPDDLLLGQLQPLPDEHAGDPVIDSFYILDPAVFGDGRGDILLPGEADSAALDGQQQHDPGYATDPGDSTGHRTGSNANLDGTFPAHNLGYQSWQQDPARLVGQWDSVMLEYGGSMTEPDLNAWLYAQPGSRAV